jgi:hypothetical protein
MTTSAWGVGLSTVAADGTVLDTRFRALGFGDAIPTDALRSRLIQELLQPDLQAWIETGLAALAGTLAPVAELQPASLVMAGG